MEMCGGEWLLQLSPTYDITIIWKSWKLFGSSFNMIDLVCLMQSVWSTNASFNGDGSWDDQNYNGEGMLLCVYQPHGEAPHVRSLQRWKKKKTARWRQLTFSLQSSDVHRISFRGHWRTQYLQQKMKSGKGCGPLYLHVLAAVELNKLVWPDVLNLLPVRTFGD